MNDLIKQVNPIYEDKELVKRLSVLPMYNKNLSDKGQRLLALLDIYKLFIPNQTTISIYNQLYISLYSSLEKKESFFETQLINDNYRGIKGLKRYGIIGGLESFIITGNAGLGKSSNVMRCVDVISGNKVIETKLGRKIIPILIVECVSDGSFKSLLLSILQAVDNQIGTNYLIKNNHTTVTIDSLLAAVSNVLINHVAVLAIDEIERVANDSKRGNTLINYLTQLVNQSNISICFIGNESANSFFELKEYLGRRTIGFSLKKFDYENLFINFINILFEYQYVLNKTELTSELARLFYKLTNGIPSMIVSLFVEVQKRSIIDGTEAININQINKTFEDSFKNMRGYINLNSVKRPKIVVKPAQKPVLPIIDDESNIFECFKPQNSRNIEESINQLSKVINIEVIKI